MQTATNLRSGAVAFLAAGMMAAAGAQENLPSPAAEGETAPEAAGSIDYDLLVERQRVEAQRRRDIRRMVGETEVLTAYTAQLTAKKANCDALREAAAAGARVQLCEGDEPLEGDAQAQSAIGLVFQRIDLMEGLAERVDALEAALEAAPETTAAATSVADAAMLPPPPEPEEEEGEPEPPPVELVYLDEATAVIRNLKDGGDVRLRLRLDAATTDRDGCVKTTRAIGGLFSGQVACFAEERSL